MTSKLSIEERIQIVLLHAKFENFQEVRRQWKNHFTTPPPQVKTIQKLVTKFKETGSVHDRERSGRARSVVTKQLIKDVREKLEVNSNFSIRKAAIEMEISKTSFHRAVIEAGF